MRRKFLAFLVWAVCLLVTCTASAAALVTDVNWGVDKYNVLRMVVDLSENTQYNIKIANDRELQIKPADWDPRWCAAVRSKVIWRKALVWTGNRTVSWSVCL